MAQQPPTITCEDVLLDEARRMSRGPRMNLELYMALKQNISSLDNTPPACCFRTAQTRPR
jgi:hypothetical protein